MLSIFGWESKAEENGFIKVTSVEFSSPVKEVSNVRIRKDRIIFYQPISARMLGEMKTKYYEKYYIEEENIEKMKIVESLVNKGFTEEQAEKELDYVLQESNSIIKGRALKKLKEKLPEELSSTTVVVVEGLFSPTINEQLFVMEPPEYLDKLLEVK